MDSKSCTPHSNPLISVTSMDNIERIRREFERFIPGNIIDAYRLPVQDREAAIVVGLSGGADSTVLALFASAYLADYYPNIHFLFTDTGAEPASCYETLDKIESFTGKHIQRISADLGLFELIDKHNGFLPSHQSRYCTNKTKIEPLFGYLKSLDDGHGYCTVTGIRFDEKNREGLSLGYSLATNTATSVPFVDLGITKAAVFEILDNTLGIPSTYRFRSRSGCSVCFYLRTSELIGLLLHSPKEFEQGERYEKLSLEDAARWDNIPIPLSDRGCGQFYPVPRFVDVRHPETSPGRKLPQDTSTKQDINTGDLFQRVPNEKPVALFAAFALYTEEQLSWFSGREFTPGVYWQEFITLSTSFTGLSASLGNYYRFRKTTPMPHYNVDDLKIVIVKIEFPARVINTGKPSSKSYTWKSGVAYKQLRHLVKHVQVTLEYFSVLRNLVDLAEIVDSPDINPRERDFADQEGAALLEQLQSMTKPTGKVVWEGLYSPPRLSDESDQHQLSLEGMRLDSAGPRAREGLNYDEVPTACIVCSV